MRIDSHQHFWKYNPAHQVWMTDEMAVLRRDYLPDELKPLLQAMQFNGTIAVQARQMVEETEWLLQLSHQNAFIQGVVGWVDLRSPNLRAQLEKYSRHPKLVGVRHVVHDEPDDCFMLRPEFRRDISQLREFNLTYDLLLFPKHLPVAVQLVTEFPNQPFVLDHIAKPGIRGGHRFLVHHIVYPHHLDEHVASLIARRRPDAVVFGHTHKPFSEIIDGVFFFNPGYAGRPRFGMERSLAILQLEPLQIRHQYIPL